jgi:hypothetical protein
MEHNQFTYLFDQLHNKINHLTTLNPTSHEVFRLKFEIKSILILLFDNLTKVSDLLKQEVFKSFEIYSNIYADIVSASENPNCSCRNRVSNFFEEKSFEVTTIFKKLLAQYPQPEAFYENIFHKMNEYIFKFNSQLGLDSEYPISLAGKVISFEKDEEFTSIMQKIIIKGHSYNGIYFKEKDNKTFLYFY